MIEINTRRRTLILILDMMFIIAALLLTRFYSHWFIFISVGVFLFPVLRIAGLLKDQDERQKALDNLSSNLALGVSMLLAMFFIALDYKLQIDGTLSFILIPVIAKAVFFAGFALSRKQALTYIGRTIGLIFVAFAILSHGFSFVTLIEATPGLVVLVFTDLSKRWRWFGLGYAGMIVFATFLFVPNFHRITAVLMYFMLVIPFSVLLIRALEKPSKES